MKKKSETVFCLKINNGVLSYLAYILGISFVLFFIMTLDFSTGRIVINFANISRFIDSFSLVIVAGLCLIALACTKAFVPLKNAVLFALGKKDLSAEQLEKSKHSLKTAFAALLISGAVGFVINMIMMKTVNSAAEISMSLYMLYLFLPLLYAAVICVFALPVYTNVRKA